MKIAMFGLLTALFVIAGCGDKESDSAETTTQPEETGDQEVEGQDPRVDELVC